MGAKDVQIKIVAFDQASGAFKQLEDSVARATQQVSNMSRVSSSSAVYNAAGVAAGVMAYNALSSAASGAMNMTLNFSRTMETNEIGIAGILMSMTTLNGETMQWGDAISISKDTMRQLNDEALRTAATSEEMVNTYRGLLGPGLAAKMTMQEIVQLTSTGVNAVKSLGLNNTQLVQELRDLVQGGIQASSSTLATALGLKDKDIKAAKESSEGLFKFLMARLEGFKVASEYTQNTFSGKIDQIKEGITRLGSTGTVPIFDAIKNQLGEIGNKLITINAETKVVEINPELQKDLTNISTKIVKIGDDLQELFLPVTTVAVPALKVAGTAAGWVSDNVVAVGRGLATWYVLQNIATMYTNVTAATNGAVASNSLLGRTVMATTTAYAEQGILAQKFIAQEMAMVEGAAATIIAAEKAKAVAKKENAILSAGILRAEESGNVVLAGQIRGLAADYIKLGVTAEEAGLMQLQAAKMAKDGNFLLATQLIAVRDAHLATIVAAREAQVAAVTGAGAMGNAVRSLGKTVLALAGGWLGVGVAAAWATSVAIDYFKNQNRIDSYNKKAEVFYEDGKYYKNQEVEQEEYTNKGFIPKKEIVKKTVRVELTPDEYQKQYSYDQTRKDMEEGNTPPIPAMPNIDPNALGLKFPGAEKDNSAKEARAAEKAYEESQKLNDKIADMMAKLNEKITEESSTTFELSSMKLKDELANMQRDLDKSAIDFGKYGIETQAVRDKMVEYEKIATAKINKVWNESWTALKNNGALMGAQILNDKQAQAEAEYQIELEKIRKEKEEREKEVGRKGDGYENVQAKINEEIDQKKELALIARNKKIRDNKLQQYDLDVQHNNMLRQLEGKTYAEIDALNRQALQSKITAIDAEITAATTSKEDRVKLEQEKVTATEQLQQISGRNMTTAASEAIRRIKDQQIDLADNMVQTWNNVNSKTSDHFKNMLTGVESLGEGIKGTIKDISTSIENMFAEMAYQQLIFQPLQNWFSNILNSFSSGTGSSKTPKISDYGQNQLNKLSVKKFFAKGGSYPGGLALVGEEGPELINFNRGGYVHTANETRNILSGGQSQQRQSQRPVVVNMNVSTPDAGSFRQSRSQVGSAAARGMQRAFRRNG
ncbi:phage tail tape measure protein [Pelosinus sp. UFO1]|uniref:phage tail tape measure protein n=1 Tax=Pelosinus sp. UFO1 TaxID=484770 RepID=UPI0004D10AB4|nr:phage tail tape measure protein [Pelosinus sp. UFO1]AIF52001.1 hypothetical protein UFO1_2454 [Pelosinus sp. UFO1]